MKGKVVDSVVEDLSCPLPFLGRMSRPSFKDLLKFANLAEFAFEVENLLLLLINFFANNIFLAPMLGTSFAGEELPQRRLLLIDAEVNPIVLSADVLKIVPLEVDISQMEIPQVRFSFSRLH